VTGNSFWSELICNVHPQPTDIANRLNLDRYGVVRGGGEFVAPTRLASDPNATMWLTVPTVTAALAPGFASGTAWRFVQGVDLASW
jgi:hypothetical protein